MLKHLQFSVTFPSTGRTITDDHHFQTGLTTITGPNEVGKSLRLEMIRYALWGTKALRAGAAKYKDLKVELDFTVKETDYNVSRAGSKATLSRGGAVVATGTTAVNLKMATDVFGYGMDVFDTSHAVGQGQIEALGAMLPSDRKRMVDSVIGLNVLDTLIDYAGKTASGFNREAEGLEQGLVKPVEPVKPPDYRSSEEIKPELDRLRALKTEKDQIAGQLLHEVQDPGQLENCEVPLTVEQLEQQQVTHLAVKRELDQFQAEHNAIPDPEYTTERLDEIEAQYGRWKAWDDYQKAVQALPATPASCVGLSVEQAQTLSGQHTAHGRWVVAKGLFDQHKVTCPNCSHAWVPNTPDPGDEPLLPTISLSDLQAHLRALAAWENAPAEVKSEAAPPFGLVELGWHRDVLAKVVRKVELAALIELREEALGNCPDVSEPLKVRRRYEFELANHNARVETYKADQGRRRKLKERLIEIGEIEDTLALLHTQFQDAIIYERDIDHYHANLARFEDLTQKIAEANTQAGNYRKAREALVALKSMVKSHLVPSLNKVASILLAQMTGGVRNTIAVNEDFEIKVDGQDLEELSGSAKAVANLAVRIGLGRVLTNRVFPVLLGDELDAAMDSERAGYTSECLRGLTSTISQIMLVSHKRLDADHTIELEAA